MQRRPAWLLELKGTRLSLRVSLLLVQVKLVPGSEEVLEGSAVGSHVELTAGCMQGNLSRRWRKPEVQDDDSSSGIGRMEPSVSDQEQMKERLCVAA